MNNPSVSVVTPVYGCAGCLEDLADRVSLALAGRGDSFEIIMVDDASPDGAWQRINEIAAVQPAVRGLRLSRNFGQHAAISAGLHHVRGDKIVVMDCDLQDLPEEIPALLDALQGDVAVALAQRVERRDSGFKRFGSWAFYRLMEWLTDSHHDHAIANFGAYRRDVIDTVNSMPETDRFFPLLVRWTGFTAQSVQVRHGLRHDGRSGYSLRQLLSLAINVALSFSDKPLRLVIRIGLVFALFALCVVAYSVYAYTVGDTQVAGFTSIIASIWLVGSSILSSVGVLGLYLGRLFNGAKGRPNFIIAEQIGGAS